MPGAAKGTARFTRCSTRKGFLDDGPEKELRSADEVLTILTEAALENEQVDKAMENMGIAQNRKQEENVVVARGAGSKSVQMALAQAAQAARQRILAGTSKTEVRYLGSRLSWNTAFAAERDQNQCSLECVARDGAVLEGKRKIQVQVQCLQGNGAGRAPFRAMRLRGAKRKLNRRRGRPHGRVPKQACEALPSIDQRTAPKAGNSANRNGAQNSSLGMGPKNGRADSRQRLSSNMCWQQFSGKRAWTSSQA